MHIYLSHRISQNTAHRVFMWISIQTYQVCGINCDDYPKIISAKFSTKTVITAGVPLPCITCKLAMATVKQHIQLLSTQERTEIFNRRRFCYDIFYRGNIAIDICEALLAKIRF